MASAEYEVVGTQAVFGHEPGSKFTKALSKGQEKRLVAAGAIRKKSGGASSGGSSDSGTAGESEESK